MTMIACMAINIRDTIHNIESHRTNSDMASMNIFPDKQAYAHLYAGDMKCVHLQLSY